jgi:hypothetical protein
MGALLATATASVLALHGLAAPADAQSPEASLSPATPEPAASLAPGASADPSAIPLMIEFGDGPFDLPNPLIGLTDLESYVATLTVTFEGTREGSPVSARATATMRVSPQGSELTINRDPDGPSTYRADIGEASYAMTDDGPCTATPVVDGDSLADLYEPAAQLLPVVGAVDEGTETIDNVPTRRYSFDQRAVIAPYLERVSGEIWVADPGGYLVRYVLSVEGGPEYFGEGTAGTRTLEYAVSEVNRPVTIGLPADCAAPADVPPLPDANEVVSRPGVISFTDASALPRAAKSYTSLLRKEGWKPSSRPVVSKTSAVLMFTKGRRALTVIMHGGPDTSTVRAVITRRERARS